MENTNEEKNPIERLKIDIRRFYILIEQGVNGISTKMNEAAQIEDYPRRLAEYFGTAYIPAVNVDKDIEMLRKMQEAARKVAETAGIGDISGARTARKGMENLSNRKSRLEIISKQLLAILQGLEPSKIERLGTDRLHEGIDKTVFEVITTAYINTLAAEEKRILGKKGLTRISGRKIDAQILEQIQVCRNVISSAEERRTPSSDIYTTIETMERFIHDNKNNPEAEECIKELEDLKDRMLATKVIDAEETIQIRRKQQEETINLPVEIGTDVPDKKRQIVLQYSQWLDRIGYTQIVREGEGKKESNISIQDRCWIQIQKCNELLTGGSLRLFENSDGQMIGMKQR